MEFSKIYRDLCNVDYTLPKVVSQPPCRSIKKKYLRHFFSTFLIQSTMLAMQYGFKLVKLLTIIMQRPKNNYLYQHGRQLIQVLGKSQNQK